VTVDEARRQVAAVARRARALGLTVGSAGNVSQRLADGRVAITPSHLPYERLRPADVPVVDAEGRVVVGDRRPSSETPLHLAIYRARDDVAAVVHTHSPFATLWAVLGVPLPAHHYAIAALGGEVPIAPYATFGTTALARSLVTTLGTGGAALIAHHGAVAVGPDLETALEGAETVEFLAALAYRARLLGGAPVLSPEELERVREQLARFPLQGSRSSDRGKPGRTG
jgi:L-fuculose-phosphate aldolase